MSGPDSPTGDHPLDDLAAYALDALDDEEREAVADHLTRCSACRDDLAAHHEMLAGLASEETPPLEVWQRVAAGIGAPGLPDPHAAERTSPSSGSPRPSEPGPSDPGLAAGLDQPVSTGSPVGAGNGRGSGGDGVVRPMRSPAPAAPAASAAPAPARARRPARVGWVAAAATVVVALGVGGVVGFALGRSDDDRTDLASLAERASDEPDGQLATLVAPDGQPVARVVADQDGAYLVLDGLENLPEGRAYQLWSLTESQPVSLGMLGRDGTNTVAFRLPPTITELAISEAPTSGEVAPTGQFLASGAITR